MAIDFTLPPDVEEVRLRVRKFMDEEVRPAQSELRGGGGDRRAYIEQILKLRQRAKEEGLWNPHLPAEYGGMDLGPVAMAFLMGRNNIQQVVVKAGKTVAYAERIGLIGAADFRSALVPRGRDDRT